MDWQILRYLFEAVFYIIPLGVGIVVSLAIAWYAWGRRSVPGAVFIADYMLCAVVWSAGTLLMMLSRSLVAQYFWNVVSWMGVFLMPVMWLAFAVQYTGHERRIKVRLWLLLSLLPLLAIAGNWGLFFILVRSGELPLLNDRFTTWGYVLQYIPMAYNLILLVVGAVLILYAMIRTPRYRGQFLSLLVGMLFPWIFAYADAFGVTLVVIPEWLSLPEINWLPMSFAIGGVIGVWGVFRYQVFDIMPVAMDTVVESIEDGVIVMDGQNRVVDLNPAAERMLGLKTAKVAGHSILEVLPDWGALAESLGQLESDERCQAVETVVAADDTARYYELHFSPLYDRRNFLAGRLLLLHDVTARRLAEIARRASEERLKFAIEGADLELWDLDLQTEKLILVEAGNSSDLSIKEHQAWFKQVYPEDREKIAAASERYANGEAELFEVEYRLQREDETWQWVLLRGKAVAFDAEGQPLRMAGISQDVTARKQAEEELRRTKEAAEKARQAAEAANRAKSVFLANMSHELRTPLNAILGFSELMTRDAAVPDDLKENLDIINRSGQHLLTLINDVLEMSKIEAGQTTLYTQSFNLHRLLDALEDMFYLRATDKGLQLLFDPEPDVPEFVRADESKLRQVLMNLISNAIKFTAEGGVTVRVGYAAGEAPRLLFEVEDSGPGVAAEDMQALFDPFVQTATGQKSQEGTGLGLPISRQFVHLMGGEITVKSVVGRGSVFSFDVRVELAEAADVPVETSNRKVVGVEPGQPTYRLLVAEDRVESRDLLLKLLRPLGFEVRGAANGQEALEIWEAWAPHFIWMDMRMPIMDGFEATRRIKATAQGQATVVVALTASAFEEDRALILSGGCDDFMRKPFRENEIFDMLTKHLGVRFLYHEQAPTAPKVSGKHALAPEALTALAPAQRAALLEAAMQADADMALAHIAQIRETHPDVAAALQTWVGNFRFDLIVAALEEGA